MDEKYEHYGCGKFSDLFEPVLHINVYGIMYIEMFKLNSAQVSKPADFLNNSVYMYIV